jgi:2-keto-3-deoxy-L-rhamnonate aldolase RhmA
MNVAPQSPFEFALWTIDPALARAAVAAGVDWIGPDLEITGKQERQAGTGSLISGHPRESIIDMRAIVGSSRLFARCNDPGRELADEIEYLIDNGLESLMIPMVRRISEARGILAQINGRTRVVMMVEHKDILDDVDELAALPGITTLYVGTNDLAISMGYRTRFGPIADGWIERISRVAHKHGIGFAFLGFARLSNSTSLAVSPDLVLAEYVRHRVRWGLFARTFAAAPESFGDELARVRERLAWWQSQPQAALDEAHARFIEACSRAEANGLPRH